jgi:uncharacterized LabA/DUF88 family protein
MLKPCYVFIDASNLFYGGENRLNWRIDYEKLISYLRYRYGAKKIYYYSGVETHGFEAESRSTDDYPIGSLLNHLKEINKKGVRVREDILNKDIAKLKFLHKLQSFGYKLRLKPIKHIRNIDGSYKVKANCDVDLTLDMVRLKDDFNSFLLFSGDGDFELLLRYFKEKEYFFRIYGKSSNTAFVIKRNFSEEYIEFEKLKEIIKQK